MAFSMPWLEFIANILLGSLFGLTLIDIFLVFSSKNPLVVERTVNNRLNLGDENEVRLKVKNSTSQPIHFSLVEGYPVEMQERSATYSGILLGNVEKEFTYQFTPKKRGDYHFGSVFILIRSVFFLSSRRIIVDLKETVHVYPSVLQLKKYELLVF